MAKSHQRFLTLQQFQVDLRGFNLDTYFPVDLTTRLVARMRGGRLPSTFVDSLRRDLLEAVANFKPDILWMEKSWVVTPEILEEIRTRQPAIRMLNYQTDDPFGTRRRDRPYWRDFLRCLPAYDVVFVVRPVNIQEFRQAGARRVLLTRYGYHDSFVAHDHRAVDPRFQHEIVFVGTALDRRVRSIRRLLLKHRLPVAVYGSRWNRTLSYYLRRSSFHGVTGGAYPEIISSSKICLGFVSWSNRDQYTERSIDIPACGGFLLAERTPKHQELYEEHREAEFFEGDEECAEKARYYLQHESLRREIAAAGNRRCRASAYSMPAVVKDVLKVLDQD